MSWIHHHPMEMPQSLSHDRMKPLSHDEQTGTAEDDHDMWFKALESSANHEPKTLAFSFPVMSDFIKVENAQKRLEKTSKWTLS